MIVLGIETSCDETGIALYDSGKGLLGDALFSQIDMHIDYSGVVPELAARDHIHRVLPLIIRVLEQAGIRKDQIDASSLHPWPRTGRCPDGGRLCWQGAGLGVGHSIVRVCTIWKVICWHPCWRKHP